MTQARRDTLCFGPLASGTVEGQDADFPNLRGRFHADADAPANMPAHLRDYIAYSAEADRLLQQDEALWDDYVGEHEARFADLVESGDWALVDAAGERHAILIPNFCADDGIVWRWGVP